MYCTLHFEVGDLAPSTEWLSSQVIITSMADPLTEYQTPHSFSVGLFSKNIRVTDHTEAKFIGKCKNDSKWLSGCKQQM